VEIKGVLLRNFSYLNKAAEIPEIDYKTAEKNGSISFGPKAKRLTKIEQH